MRMLMLRKQDHKQLTLSEQRMIPAAQSDQPKLAMICSSSFRYLKKFLPDTTRTPSPEHRSKQLRPLQGCQHALADRQAHSEPVTAQPSPLSSGDQQLRPGVEPAEDCECADVNGKHCSLSSNKCSSSHQLHKIHIASYFMQAQHTAATPKVHD